MGCAQVRLSAVDELTDTEVESLRAALPHLTPLHSPHITLVLDSFTLDAAFVELLAQAAVGWQVLSLQAVTWPVASPPTTLPTLGFIDIAQPMNDQVLQQLAACLTAVNICVYTPRVSLQAALPAGRRLPWPGVYAETRMSVSELVNQAGLMGGSIDWDCEHLELCLSMEEVWCTRTHTRTYTHTHALVCTATLAFEVCATCASRVSCVTLVISLSTDEVGYTHTYTHTHTHTYAHTNCALILMQVQELTIRSITA